MNRLLIKSGLLLFLTQILVVGLPEGIGADPLSTIRELDQAYVNIAQKITRSVVRVSSSKTVPVSDTEGLEHSLKKFHSPFGFGHPGAREILMGSGFIVSPDGMIMTNYHVVKGMKPIKVTLPENKEYEAKLIGADKDSDIAVIKIAAKDLQAVVWGDCSQLRVGAIVIAIGNPFGLSGTVTNGIISATGRTNVGIIGHEDFIQTDAPINPGNSGGPLVNLDGNVIGINTAIVSESGGYAGIGFAIPSNSAKTIMDDLVKYGKVKHGLWRSIHRILRNI